MKTSVRWLPFEYQGVPSPDSCVTNQAMPVTVLIADDSAAMRKAVKIFRYF